MEKWYFTLNEGKDKIKRFGCLQRRSTKVTFKVRIEIIEQCRSTVGQCAFPRVAILKGNKERLL